jgi:thiamine transport system permease protein
VSLDTFGRRFPYGWILFALAMAFLAVLFYYPLFEILRRSFSDGGALDLSGFSEIADDSYYLERLLFTIWLAVASTLATLALGIPSAYVFARYDFPGKALVRAVSTIPFVMPAIVVALGFIALLGPEGIVNEALMDLTGRSEPPLDWVGTFQLIILAHVFYNYTIVMRIVSGFWADLDPGLEEASRSLGAGRLQTLLHVTLPLLGPAVAAAALLVFIFSFTSFGVVLILGSREHTTLEVEIFRQTTQIFDLQVAGALAATQAVFTFVFLFAYVWLQERTGVRIDFRPLRTAIVPRTWRQKTLVAVNALVVLVVVVSPLLALLQRSLWVDGGYSLANFESLFSSSQGPIRFVEAETAVRNSLVYAALTVVIAVPLGTVIAYRLAAPGRFRAVLDAFLMLPLGVSAVTLGFGFLITLDEPPLDLRASWLLLVVAHSLVAYPFVVRAVLAVLRGINPSLREAAATLGAGRLRTFREIDLPVIWRGLAVGAVFAFAVSLGEFGATLLLVRPEFTTMPVAIFRSLGQPGQLALGEALAMSTILMVVAGAGFLFIERLRYRGVGEF